MWSRRASATWSGLGVGAQSSIRRGAPRRESRSTLGMGNRARSGVYAPCGLPAPDSHQLRVSRLADRDIRPCRCNTAIGTMLSDAPRLWREAEEAHDRRWRHRSRPRPRSARNAPPMSAGATTAAASRLLAGLAMIECTIQKRGSCHRHRAARSEVSVDADGRFALPSDGRRRGRTGSWRSIITRSRTRSSSISEEVGSELAAAGFDQIAEGATRVKKP